VFVNYLLEKKYKYFVFFEIFSTEAHHPARLAPAPVPPAA